MKALALVLFSLSGVCLLSGTFFALVPLLIVNPGGELAELALTRGLPLVVTGGVLAILAIHLQPGKSQEGSPPPSKKILIPVIVAGYSIITVVWGLRRLWGIFYRSEAVNPLEVVTWVLGTIVVMVVLVNRGRSSAG